MDKKIRCFIAINLPKEVIHEIEKAQKEIEEKRIIYGKFTEAKNLHLTLKFLGEISEEKIEEVKKRLMSIKQKKFESKINSLGFFDNNRSKIYKKRVVLCVKLTHW